ncbi:MAG: hypothetical protein JSW03_01675 [Candidatus Eiseniibacteriota bacterium]|nr:MAG: hypothetical protein JSW03_01675 [Candidatus Eisenbacteria bacterium]
MTVGERRARLIMWAFGVVTLVCLLLLVMGPEALGWEEKHLYLLCLSLTAVAHVFWLVPYVFTRAKEERVRTAVDERDMAIFYRANAAAARLCCGFFFVGSMLMAMRGIHLTGGVVHAPTLLLLVLSGSLAFMLTQSITSLILYRTG